MGWGGVGWGGVCRFEENVNFYLLRNFNFENFLGASPLWIFTDLKKNFQFFFFSPTQNFFLTHILHTIDFWTGSVELIVLT